jgi:hypothetical protein
MPRAGAPFCGYVPGFILIVFTFPSYLTCPLFTAPQHLVPRLLISTPCSVSLPNSMNKLGNRPVKILERAPLNQFRWTSSSTKVFVATAGTLFALSATVVICLIAFSTHRPKRSGSNGSVGVPVPPATKVITPAEKGNGSVAPLPETNQADPGTIATEHSAVDQTPTPPVNPIPTPAPVPQPESKAFTSDSELLRGERPEFGPKKVERQLPKSVRKNLENERREAERKRARLEDMYQRHLITSEAYKKGEREYKIQIEKYRSAVNAGGTLPNSLE